MSGGWPVRWKEPRDRDWIDALISEQWGGEPLIVHDTEYILSDSPTLIAGERDGAAVFTFGAEGMPPELLLLHALRQGAGIGRALLDAVAGELRKRKHDRLFVTTTNDNTAALKFYQRYGFRLYSVRIGAVDDARRRKPAIPLIGNDGIALHDEIDLVLNL
ncbi:MAG: GNAT family N-acetyltransferase [Candidatus Eremiobacteraeota bacterium]|nr:GNAT family N-acetyltransferase [Candidatus Eremiobacteraeota bacterium]